MADGTIFDQAAETVLTAAHRVLVQDTSAATASQSATFALMGGLEIDSQTITTADVTGTVGKLYVCTIAGLTANRNLTLPSAQVGERVGVHIVDGDATYELILKGAASQTINGGSAATEWSRVFIQGECVIFRCTAANTWIVESDGRIPCSVFGYLSSTATDLLVTAGTYYQVPFDTSGHDNCSMLDLTENHILIRRAGKYLMAGRWYSSESPTATELFSIKLSINNNDTTLSSLIYRASAASGYQGNTLSFSTAALAVDDTLEMWARVGGTNNYDIAGSSGRTTFLSLEESL